MSLLLRTSVLLPFLALAACDEIAVADDPVALAELRGGKSCIRAVQKETGVSGAAINQDLPVVEINQYVIDVPNGPSWTCFTDDNGRATELLPLRTG